jgi:SAM-dependent methyltransferase
MPDRAAPWDAVATERLYERWIISPFAPGVDFRLPRDVRRLLARWTRRGDIGRRVVLDLGCGRGDATALVAGRVGFAAALDISRPMLELSGRFLAARGVSSTHYRGRDALVRMATDLGAVAAGRRRGPATALARADLRNLSTLRATGDLVLAINSISPPRASEVGRMFGELANALKPGGVLMAVLPSLESFEYLLDLARRRGARLHEAGRVDACGMFHESGETQKFFTSDEVRALCRASGLRAVSLAMVRYPWALMARFGWGNFPGSPRLWDWHLVARAR